MDLKECTTILDNPTRNGPFHSATFCSTNVSDTSRAHLWRIGSCADSSTRRAPCSSFHYPNFARFCQCARSQLGMPTHKGGGSSYHHRSYFNIQPLLSRYIRRHKAHGLHLHSDGLASNAKTQPRHRSHDSTTHSPTRLAVPILKHQANWLYAQFR